MVMMQNTFERLVGKYTTEWEVTQKLWKEIESNYSETGRFYHTLSHLDNMLEQLQKVRASINNWDAVVFALFYHDIIYNPLKTDNEEESASLALSRLSQIQFPNNSAGKCKELILSTKSHGIFSDPDINYFTDSDLSILGQPWEDYLQYANDVRKEYSMYPDILYKPGRKKVLEHFLSMQRIYKTDFFFESFEDNARQNLNREISFL